MRYLTIVIAVAVSLSAAAQSVEIIRPGVIGEDLTAVWTIVLTNPGEQQTPLLPLRAAFYSNVPRGELIEVPPACTKTRFDEADCAYVSIAPHERRELRFVVRYDGRYGQATGVAYLDYRSTVGEAVFPHGFPVTNVEDSGPGSLRQAIEEMNAACIAQYEPCGPEFRIEGPVPAEGWFTIRPLSPLPPVTALWTSFDGSSQTRHTGDTNPNGPEVMLDGSAAGSGHGLWFRGTQAAVNELAIGNFPGNGIETAVGLARVERCLLTANGLRGLQMEGGYLTVVDNILSRNVRSGGWFVTNQHVTIARNRFIGNGASGFYSNTPRGYYNLVTVEENVITDNAHAGISLGRNSIGSYANNTFLRNLGRAIDIGIDGPTLDAVMGLPGQGGQVGAPAVLSARYENGETVVELRMAPRLGHVYLGEEVDVYASPIPKDGGEVVARVFPRDGSPFLTVRVPRDLRGQFVSAATFAIYIFNWDDAAPGTSEVGEPALVE